MSRGARAEIIALAAASAAGALSWALWSGKNSLSVLVGGVIGCANLRLWRYLVAGLVADQGVSRLELTGRFLLKGLFLLGVIWVVLKSPLAPLGVLTGFGIAYGTFLWMVGMGK